MENVGRRRRRVGQRTLTHDPKVQEFVPSSGWTEDSNGHYLLVDLPDFQKEEVKLQVDNSGLITVSGERQTSDDKYIIRFNQEFTLPPNSDSDKISGKIDGGLLLVTVPKPAREEMKQPVPEAEIHDEITNAEENKRESTLHRTDEDALDEKRGGDDHGSLSNEKKKKRKKDSRVDSFGEDFLWKWGQEPSQFERAIKMLRRNKGIVITALLAFSLGVLVSRKFGSAGHDEAV